MEHLRGTLWEDALEERFCGDIWVGTRPSGYALEDYLEGTPGVGHPEGTRNLIGIFGAHLYTH